MGIKNVTDLTQLNPSFPDALNPTRKDYHLVPFQVARTNTTAFKVAVVPADATIIGFRWFVQTASNAGTTAAVTLTGQGVGPTGQAMNFGSQSVLTAGSGLVDATVGTAGTGVMNLERPPAVYTQGDMIIYATYAETGTASTTGGPFIFLIEYVR
jgi:hypothetical protein